MNKEKGMLAGKSNQPATIDRNASAIDALTLMPLHNFTSVIVMNGNNHVGILTERDNLIIKLLCGYPY